MLITPLSTQKPLLQWKHTDLRQPWFPVLKETFCSASTVQKIRRSLEITKVVLVSLTFPDLCGNRNNSSKRHRKAFLLSIGIFQMSLKLLLFQKTLLLHSTLEPANHEARLSHFLGGEGQNMDVELSSVLLKPLKVSGNRSILIVAHAEICDFPKPV